MEEHLRISIPTSSTPSTLSRPISPSLSPSSQTQSPNAHSPGRTSEKAIFPHNISFERDSRFLSAGPSRSSPNQSFCRGHSPISNQSMFLRNPRSLSSQYNTRRLRIANLLRPWLPIILYALTSLVFLIAIAFYKAELFSALDELSRWLQADSTYGQAVLFFLIFLTTFPPVPLYSTLIILSGYTFGPWTGAVISYFAALSGALVVFLLSRTLLRESISRWLSSTCTLKRVVRAIEKRPKLLFLIRLAPYPYNVMNCLLAASPTLTLRTYTLCTALSLFKVIIHSSLGASIHSFKDYHMVTEDGKSSETEESHADTVARMWTVFGIALCVAIFIYLSYVARKAVDEELEDGDEEETVSFLDPEANGDLEQCDLGDQPAMTEHSHQLISPRPSMSLESPQQFLSFQRC
ncbi:hypothetical protein EV360DRAFT_84647 [Lentinula raphanica]|nr:hypothetical protein EV360DRAFT_84647 [Lentinula raphanica]